jgi:uncharacterized protein YjbI with pentapeptide repeats
MQAHALEVSENLCRAAYSHSFPIATKIVGPRSWKKKSRYPAKGIGSDADLSRANLNGADLNGADLGRAELFQASLTGAHLRYAVLVSADLLTDALIAKPMRARLAWLHVHTKFQ